MAWHRRRSNPMATELGHVAPLATCGRRQRAELARHVDRLRLADGTVVARARSTARQVVIVLDGALRVGRTGLAGRGATIDAVPVVDGGASPADVVAVGEVDVLVIEAPAFRWAVDEDPGLAAWLAAARTPAAPTGAARSPIPQLAFA